ncbi:unnamed protein product [Danaus chrysippus]|uniref:(African queen) hypothetical protein n=1 Tax=Danaus chrysippus TaxID=151541 RepID=A0A8J2QS04_9NEOP|nr:unnamed protein product [Danaus chrysippus]
MLDRLKLVPIQKWPEIRSLLKLYLPRSIAGLNFLETREEIEKLGYDYKAKVYCPDGDASNGIVALNVKDKLYEVNIQCPKDDTRELEEALRTTKVIDWTRDIKLIYTQNHVMQCMMKVIRDKNIAIQQVIPSVTFVKYNNDPLFDVR